MSHCAIVGINWGDEGKGRMVDYLSDHYGAVIRYQGGNNAGHTVVNGYGKFALNLLPCGIFNPGTMNVLGTGMVVNPEHLCHEMAMVREKGVSISPENLRISDRAVMVLPIHPAQDQWEEERLGSKSFGSTRRGISPAYGDRAMKKALRMGDLLYPDNLEEELRRLIDWKNQVFAPGYGQKPLSYEDTLAWIHTWGDQLKDYITDAGSLLKSLEKDGRSFLFEAQLGALRDLDYGIYPYTSSSSPLSCAAPVGCGYPAVKIDRVVGTVKAYSTCVGEGPFVGELEGDMAHRLREAGAEYGAATGRPRRVGWLDMVATRYGVELQAATELAVTKLDVLSGFDELPVCVAYEMDGDTIDRFPYTPSLYRCKPVYRVFPGWKKDISSARKIGDLPREAREYVDFMEKSLSCPITFVSVGAERHQLIRL